MQYIFEINQMTQIPIINIGPLFSQNASKKTEVDKAIARAAFEIGFMVVVGHPKKLEVGQDQRDIMLKLFNLSEEQQRPFGKKILLQRILIFTEDGSLYHLVKRTIERDLRLALI